MSFKDLVKQKILQTIKEIKTDWKILIMDKTCLRTISSACGMFDIMAQGVTLVDDLFKEREPMPTMDVIYYITPTKESIERWLQEGEDQYRNMYLLFSTTIPDEIVNKIKQSKASQLKKIKLIKEIYFEFFAYEQRVFHFDEKNSFKEIYNKKFSQYRDQAAQEMAKKLSGIFINLGENPIVRYQRSNPLCQTVAERFSRLIETYTSNSSSFPEKSTRPIFLIIDRSFDLVSPFLHELTYQAMLKEFLAIKSDEYTYEVEGEDKKEEKVAILNENDPLWPLLRHLYIGDAIQCVVDNFKSFSVEAKNFDPSSFKNISEMQTALQNLPRITELKSKYSLHMNLSKTVSKKFTDNMKTIISREQDIATKEDFKSKKIKSSQRASIVKELLGNRNLDEESRLRILLLFIGGEGEIDKNLLSDCQEIAGFGPKSKNAIQALISMLDKNRPNLKPKKNKSKEISKTAEFFRYKPLLSVLLEDLSANVLSKDDFPFLKPGESAMNNTKDVKKDTSSETKNVSLIGASVKPTGGGSSWKNRNKNDSKDTKDSNTTISNNKKESVPNLSCDKRIIIFVVGGVSYSEMRTVYEMSSQTQTDIILGSTFLYSGHNFYDQIIDIN